MSLQLPREADFSASIFRRGQKKELFDGTQEDEASLESELKSKVEELASLWAAERVGKELSAAIWRPELDLAEVVLQRGKAVTHLGCQQRSKLYLHLEEAVYLIDRANLLLFIEEPGKERRLLSLQEATDLMVSTGVSLDIYLVFCKLTRAGYIVQRHPARWMAGPKEDLKGIWAHWRRPTEEACLAGGNEAGVGGSPRQSGTGVGLPSTGMSTYRAVASKRRKRESGARDWWSCEDAWLAPDELSSYLESLPRAVIEMGDPKASAKARYPLLHPLPPGLVEEWQSGPPSCPNLHLDVWDVDARFSRRGAGEPMFHVSVWTQARAPTVAEMAAAEMAAGDVPIKFATIEKGDIGFYSFSHVRLQDIL